MRIAEHFAKEDGCLGMITGESIGQVASQTMQSLAATNDVCTMPVYRPLIGFDKQEIVEISHKIKSGNSVVAFITPSSPSQAEITLYPSNLSRVDVLSKIKSESSMTNIFFILE